MNKQKKSMEKRLRKFNLYLFNLGGKQVIEFVNSEISLAQKELREEMIKLSDDIESKYGTPDIEEWKAFKHFRNKMRDNLTN